MGKKLYLLFLISYGNFVQSVGNPSSENIEKKLHHFRPKRLVNSTLNGRLFQVPYVVYILKNGINNCIGNILTDSIILTAANCIREDNVIYTVLTSSSYSGPIIHHNVTKKFLYPHFNPRTLENDLGLFTILPPISDQGFHQKINIYNGTLPVNAVLTLTGWAHTKHELRSVILKRMRMEECRFHYRGFRDITNKNICALDRNRLSNGDAGDVGGSLVFIEKLVGIYSWTGREGLITPDVFTNLLDFIYTNWIHRIIQIHHGLI